MLNHRGTDTIKTRRLVLRPYLDGDGDAMYLNWANDEELWQRVLLSLGHHAGW